METIHGTPLSPRVIVRTTERLVLRRMTVDDAAFILELVNEPSFIRNIGDRGVRTLEDARAYIAKGALTMYERHGFGLYAVELKDASTPIGICGLLKRDTLEDVDVGFAFLPTYWSHGYAYEAAAAVMTHGRDVLGIDRIVAITSPGNEASIKLLKKLGLTLDRTIRLPGEESDTALFRSPDREGSKP
jgi:RimJ/RimL family protein N-acetyltransferase